MLSLRKWVKLIVLLTCIAVLIVLWPLIKKVNHNDYNIIFISIDTLRADHLGCYGYQRATSPNIDNFAKRNILFKNFFTVVPKTGPSMTTFFTGKYIQKHGVITNTRETNASIPKIAQLLPLHYRKAAFGTNMTLTAERGYADGFDEYTIIPGGQKNLTPTAIKWVSENKDKSPFFLWLHYIDPHGPYKPPVEFHEMFVNDKFYDSSKKVELNYTPIKGLNENVVLGAVPKYQRVRDIDTVAYYIAQYDAEIRYTDREVGKLLNYLSSADLLMSSIIIITADHGESLGENNYYFEHGMLVNEGSIHIPLLIGHPEINKPIIINSLLQNTDLAPTLLGELGINFPNEIDGINFSELYWKRKTEKQCRDFIYSCTSHEYPDYFETARTYFDKLIRKNEKEFFFYDIIKDTREEKNLLFGSVGISQIKEHIMFINKFDRNSIKPTAEVELSKEKLDALRTLGYTD